MKLVPKVLLTTLVASVFGMVGFSQILLSEDKSFSDSSLIIEKATFDNSITLLLPQVIVELKEGKPKYGWLTQFNSPKKELQPKLSPNKETFYIFLENYKSVYSAWCEVFQLEAGTRKFLLLWLIKDCNRGYFCGYVQISFRFTKCSLHI